MKYIDWTLSQQTMLLRMHTQLHGNLSLLNLDGTAMSTKCKPVLITKISPEMLCIITNLKLPKSNHYRVGLDFTFVNIEVRLSGFISWSISDYHMHHYGVALSLSEFERRAIVSLLKIHLVNMSPDYVKIHRIYEAMSRDYLLKRSGRFNQTI